MATTDVDEVCTDQHLGTYMGGQPKYLALLPKEWKNSSKDLRQQMLDRVVEALRRRTPPIFEADLTVKTELRNAVLFGSAARLYYWAASRGTDEDLNWKRYREESALFQPELAGLTPTLLDGRRGPGLSLTLERR